MSLQSDQRFYVVQWKMTLQDEAPPGMVLLRVKTNKPIPHPDFGNEHLWKEKYWKNGMLLMSRKKSVDAGLPRIRSMAMEKDYTPYLRNMCIQMV